MLPGFTAAFKDIQMETRRLKRIDSKEHTEESREASRAARKGKGRIIKKAQQAHREREEEAARTPGKFWKLVKWANKRGANTYTLIPALKNYTRETITDTATKADLLC